MHQPPLVSVVIPTRNRADLVCRAVRSALAQGIEEIEVIVVVDGPDAATTSALSQIGDTRITIVPLEENVGGSEARNIGVRASQGQWIALLDDDDEWLPGKIEKQLQLARNYQTDVIVATRFFDRLPNTDLVRPTKFPAPLQPMSEFLFCEVGWFGGIPGFPQTSTWFISRSLMLNVPFTKGLKSLQDLDWLLHAFASEPKPALALIHEPLTIFYNDSSRQRVGKSANWRYSADWATKHQSLFTPKAFAFFIVVFCVNPAAREGAPRREVMRMVRLALSSRCLSPKLFWLICLYTLVYPTAGRILSPNRRQAMLYRLATFLRTSVE